MRICTEINRVIYDQAGKKFFIQAKRYKSAINPTHVKEFAQIVATRNVAGGFFLHTGRTGKTSHKNTTRDIQIISGDRLLKLIKVSVNDPRNHY